MLAGLEPVVNTMPRTSLALTLAVGLGFVLASCASSEDEGRQQPSSRDPQSQKPRGPSGQATRTQRSGTAASGQATGTQRSGTAGPNEVSAPEIRVTRVGVYAVVDYRAPSPKSAALLLTVDSPTDPRGPATFSVDLRQRRSGRKRLPLPLEDRDDYTVLASVFTEAAAQRSRVVSAPVP